MHGSYITKLVSDEELRSLNIFFRKERLQTIKQFAFRFILQN